MSLNRMLFKNSKKDDFILYLERTIETFKDDNIDSIGDYAFAHCSSLTSIHFAAKNRETIETLSGYSSKFGATKATSYFDL